MPDKQHCPAAAHRRQPAARSQRGRSISPQSPAAPRVEDPRCRRAAGRARAGLVPVGRPAASSPLASRAGSRPVPWLSPVGQGLCPASVPGVCKGAMLGLEGRWCWCPSVGGTSGCPSRADHSGHIPGCGAASLCRDCPHCSCTQGPGAADSAPLGPRLGRICKAGDAGPPKTTRPNRACQTPAEHPCLPGAEVRSRRSGKPLPAAGVPGAGWQLAG